jgi:hypothetical protein
MAAVAPAAKPAMQVISTTNAPANNGDETTVTRAADGSTVTIYPPDAKGRRKVVSRSADGSTIVRYADRWDRSVAVAEAKAGAAPIAIAIGANGLTITPEFVAAMRAAAPELNDASMHQITGMRVLGVTPEFARSIASAGFPSIGAHDLMEARAVGLSAAYVNAMRSAGVEGDLDDFIQLRAVGVDPRFAARVRASGIRHLDADTLIEMSAVGSADAVAPHGPRIRVKLKREGKSERDGGNPDANPDPEVEPDPDG